MNVYVRTNQICSTRADASNALFWYKSVYTKTMLYVLFLCLQTNLFLRTKCKLKSSMVEADIAMYVRQQSANKIQHQSFRKSFRSGKAKRIKSIDKFTKMFALLFSLAFIAFLAHLLMVCFVLHYQQHDD